MRVVRKWRVGRATMLLYICNYAFFLIRRNYAFFIPFKVWVRIREDIQGQPSKVLINPPNTISLSKYHRYDLNFSNWPITKSWPLGEGQSFDNALIIYVITLALSSLSFVERAILPLPLVELACASSPVSRACFRILSRWSSLLAHPLPHPYDEWALTPFGRALRTSPSLLRRAKPRRIDKRISRCVKQARPAGRGTEPTQILLGV
jgi:hypothetical protein